MSDPHSSLFPGAPEGALPELPRHGGEGADRQGSKQLAQAPQTSPGRRKCTEGGYVPAGTREQGQARGRQCKAGKQPSQGLSRAAAFCLLPPPWSVPGPVGPGLRLCTAPKQLPYAHPQANGPVTKLPSGFPLEPAVCFLRGPY